MKKFILVATIFFTVIVFSPVFATDNTVNSGWVNVPLTDTQPFNPSCEYRVSDGFYNYTSIYTSTQDIYMRTDGSGHTIILRVNYKDKSSIAGGSEAKKIEKRCKLPDTAPSGMIGQFALAQCPDGWSTWLFAKATVECNTSNCKIAVCKKD